VCNIGLISCFHHILKNVYIFIKNPYFFYSSKPNHSHSLFFHFFFLLTYPKVLKPSPSPHDYLSSSLIFSSILFLLLLFEFSPSLFVSFHLSFILFAMSLPLSTKKKYEAGYHVCVCVCPMSLVICSVSFIPFIHFF